MSEWSRCDPPENKLVEVKGSDCLGTWYGVAKKLTYKKKPKGYKKNWRWVYADGERCRDQFIDEWKEIA